MREAIKQATEELPFEMRMALRAVRERVAQDRLPLLSLLQDNPMQMQSSHLSFQEYYAVSAIAKGMNLPSELPPPWAWGPWWVNGLRLGCEMQQGFATGLLKGVGLDGSQLDLREKLPVASTRASTAFTALGLMMKHGLSAIKCVLSYQATSLPSRQASLSERFLLAQPRVQRHPVTRIGDPL